MPETEQSVEPWFKPWAYAFILLREQGYPTVFLADWTGAESSITTGMLSFIPMNGYLED